jgi:hypothetical protein
MPGSEYARYLGAGQRRGCGVASYQMLVELGMADNWAHMIDGITIHAHLCIGVGFRRRSAR